MARTRCLATFLFTTAALGAISTPTTDCSNHAPVTASIETREPSPYDPMLPAANHVAYDLTKDLAWKLHNTPRADNEQPAPTALKATTTPTALADEQDRPRHTVLPDGYPITNRAGESLPQRITGTLGFCGLPGQACGKVVDDARVLTVSDAAEDENVATDLMRRFGVTQFIEGSDDASKASQPSAIARDTVPERAKNTAACSETDNMLPSWWNGSDQAAMCGIHFSSPASLLDGSVSGLQQCCLDPTKETLKTPNVECFRFCETRLNEHWFKKCVTDKVAGRVAGFHPADHVDCNLVHKIKFRYELQDDIKTSQADRAAPPIPVVQQYNDAVVTYLGASLICGGLLLWTDLPVALTVPIWAVGSLFVCNTILAISRLLYGIPADLRVTPWWT